MPDHDQPATEVIPRKDPSLPRAFGGYRLLCSLANGMALVYLAEQANPKRRVVVKIPRGGLLLTEESRQRFLREVELAANADHAGIVPVLEAGEIDGSPYYTMPYIEGKPMDQYLASNCPKLEDKLALFRQLCEVVGALHKNGLIHRDLKPANVLVDTHGSIRLLDFGLAKSALELSDVSLSPTVMGTLDYMAPEQAGSATEVGPPADVYAIGVMLYKAVTGESPYPISKDLPTQLRMIAETPPKAPDQLNRNLPKPLTELILRCLQKNPGKRPANAQQLQALLSEVAATRPVSSRAIPISLAIVLIAGLLTAAFFLLPENIKIATPPEGTALTPNSDYDRLAASPGHESLESEHYSAREIAALNNPIADPRRSNSPVPAQYWPLYNQVQKELQDNFDRRRQAALILALASDQPPSIVKLTQGSREFSQQLTPGSAQVIYLTGGESAQLTHPGSKTQIQISSGQIQFIAFD